MNTTLFRISSLALVTAIVVSTGCTRRSRGNTDAAEQNKAANPAEGGSTSTAGSAGESKNFGDTRKKTEVEGKSQSASPTGLSKDVVPGTTPTSTTEPATTPPPSGK